MAQARLLIVLLSATLGLSACATVDQGDFVALQHTVAREQNKTRDLTKRLDQLTKSVEGSRMPQANLVADMDFLRQEIARMQGRLEEEAVRSRGDDESKDMERRLARIEAYLGMAASGEAPAAPPRPAPAAPQAAQPPHIPASAPPPSDANTADGLYNLAVRLYKQKSYPAARDRFNEFGKKYSKDRRTDDAQFMVGESLYAERKFEEAILEYNQLVKKFPNSGRAPAALLKQGMAFNELGDKRTAKIVYHKLIKTYPNSSEAKQAEKLAAKLP